MNQRRDFWWFLTGQSTRVEVAELSALAARLVELRKRYRPRLSKAAKLRLVSHLQGTARAWGVYLCNLRYSRLIPAEHALVAEEMRRRDELVALKAKQDALVRRPAS